MLTPERALVAQIERVLAAVEKNGLAYCEATDLAVARSTTKLLAEAPPKDVAGSWKVGGAPDDLFAHVGDTPFVRAANKQLVEVDVARLPPEVANTPSIAHFRREERTGWTLVERHVDAKPPRFRLFERAPSLTSKALDMARPGRPRDRRRQLAGRHVLRPRRNVAPARLLALSNGTFIAVPGVPRTRSKGGYLAIELVFGSARTGDGSEVVDVGRRRVQLLKGMLKKTVPLAAKRSGDWTFAPAAPGAFYYLSNRQPFLAQRGKKPQRVASKLTNVMRIAEGPTGASSARWATARTPGPSRSSTRSTR